MVDNDVKMWNDKRFQRHGKYSSNLFLWVLDHMMQLPLLLQIKKGVASRFCLFISEITTSLSKKGPRAKITTI